MKLGGRNRRGIGLIELVIVMVGLTIVSGLCVALITTFFKLERTGRAHMHALHNVDRLARALRADARAARKAIVLPGILVDADKLALQLSDARFVEYVVRADHVRRDVFEGKQVVQRERFLLPTRGGVWTLDGPLVRLTLDRRSDKTKDLPPRPFVIEAAVGADLRFEKGGKS